MAWQRQRSRPVACKPTPCAHCTFPLSLPALPPVVGYTSIARLCIKFGLGSSSHSHSGFAFQRLRVPRRRSSFFRCGEM